MLKTICNLVPNNANKDSTIAIESVLLMIIIAIALVLLQSLLVMIFWNLTIPHIFKGVGCINFLQALGLVLLVDFLFA